jgi:hypothetical protein
VNILQISLSEWFRGSPTPLAGHYTFSGIKPPRLNFRWFLG